MLVDSQVAHLFSEWCQICDHLNASDAAYSRYVMQLQHIGLLKGDEFTEHFFRILTVIILLVDYTLSVCVRVLLFFTFMLIFESIRNLLLHTL